MELSNYRPISVLNIYSKIFERLMYNRLIQFLDKRFKIQYAFIRQEHNIIYNHMNENNIRLETSTKEQKEPLS